MRCDREQPLVGRNKVKNRTMKIAGPSTPTADLVRPGSSFRLIQTIESLVEMTVRQISGWVRTAGYLRAFTYVEISSIVALYVHVEGTGISLENSLVVGVL